MARARNPKRAEAYKIYMDSGGTIKLIDLAKRLDLSANRIRKWKSEDNWGNKERSFLTQKERSFKKRQVKKKLVKSVEENEELNDQQREFCLYYANSNNATQSYLKVYTGVTKESAMANSCRLLARPSIKKEIKKLKDILRTEFDVDVADMIGFCLKVVGADIGDYVSFGKHEELVIGQFGPVKNPITGQYMRHTVSTVTLSDSSRVDTTLLQEVKQGKDGIAIKLADKKWAWDKLERYFGWKNKGDMEEQQLRIAKLKAEVDAAGAAGPEQVIIVDDIPDAGGAK